jgi:primosomal protein N' (replication factor Y)
MTPENQTIRQAARQDYESFYRSEITLRQLQSAPPFSELYTVTATGVDEAAVLRCSAFVQSELKKLLRAQPETRVLGPAPLPVVRVRSGSAIASP